MSDGGRERASIGVELWKSSQKLIAQRSAVRSIAWLDGYCSNWKRVRVQNFLKLIDIGRPKDDEWRLIGHIMVYL